MLSQLFQILFWTIIIFQFVLLYRSGKMRRTYRANTYIISCATSREDPLCPTVHPGRNKYIQAPLELVTDGLKNGDAKTLTLLAMLYGATGPAKLCYSMAQFRDGTTSDGFRSAPLLWLQFRYYGRYYVSYLMRNAVVTMSYYDFISVIYSNAEVAQSGLAEDPTDTATL